MPILISRSVGGEFLRTIRRVSHSQNVLGFFGMRCSRCTYCTGSSSNDHQQQMPNEKELSENDKMVIPNFVNRNPRNLEYMGIAKKRKGWRLQYPTREFYHRLLFGFNTQNSWAWVENSSGNVLITASTKEWVIKKRLNRTSNMSAAINIGRVIAHRCAMAGITGLHFQVQNPDGNTNRISTFQMENAFFNAVMDCGITGFEPEEFFPDYFPGIDYDTVIEEIIGAKPPKTRWRTSLLCRTNEEAKVIKNKVEEFLEGHAALGYGKWHHNREEPPHNKNS